MHLCYFQLCILIFHIYTIAPNTFHQVHPASLTYSATNMAEYGKLGQCPCVSCGETTIDFALRKSQSLLKEAVELSPGCSNLVKTAGWQKTNTGGICLACKAGMSFALTIMQTFQLGRGQSETNYGHIDF